MAEDMLPALVTAAGAGSCLLPVLGGGIAGRRSGAHTAGAQGLVPAGGSCCWGWIVVPASVTA